MRAFGGETIPNVENTSINASHSYIEYFGLLHLILISIAIKTFIYNVVLFISHVVLVSFILFSPLFIKLKI